MGTETPSINHVRGITIAILANVILMQIADYIFKTKGSYQSYIYCQLYSLLVGLFCSGSLSLETLRRQRKFRVREHVLVLGECTSEDVVQKRYFPYEIISMKNCCGTPTTWRDDLPQ